jgi:hypothetical protein
VLICCVLTQAFSSFLPRRTANGSIYSCQDSECKLVAYQLTVSKCLLPLYKPSSKLLPVSLLSASVLPACDHYHSTQRNPRGSENINHTCMGFRNINHTCVALTDLLVVVVISTDTCIGGIFFFNIYLGQKLTVLRTEVSVTLISGRLRY